MPKGFLQRLNDRLGSIPTGRRAYILILVWALFFGALIALDALFLRDFLNAHVGAPIDISFYRERTQGVLDGLWLYRDIPCESPPLIVYLMIPAQLANGGNLAYQTWFSIFVLLSTLTLYWGVRRFDDKLAFFAAVMFIFVPVGAVETVLGIQDESIAMLRFLPETATRRRSADHPIPPRYRPRSYSFDWSRGRGGSRNRQHSRPSEALHGMAQSLRKAGGMIVSFLGPKGGTGTTTLAVNAAADVRRITERPSVVVDLKSGLVDVARFLGLRPYYTLLDVVDQVAWMDPVTVSRLVTEHDCGLDVLAAGDDFGRPAPRDAEAVEQTLRCLSGLYDYVVIDAGSALTPCFVYIWLPYMIIPIQTALERVPKFARSLERPGG